MSGEVHNHFHFPADPRLDEVVRLLRRIDKRGREMATLREEAEARFAAMIEEVRQTRTAADANLATTRNILAQLQLLRDDLSNKLTPDDIQRMDAVIAGLNESQGILAQAAAEGVDPAPRAAPEDAQNPARVRRAPDASRPRAPEVQPEPVTGAGGVQDDAQAPQAEPVNPEGVPSEQQYPESTPDPAPGQPDPDSMAFAGLPQDGRVQQEDGDRRQDGQPAQGDGQGQG